MFDYHSTGSYEPPKRPVRLEPRKHQWIADHLARQGHTQAALARAWGIAPASVSRFLQGVEGQDITLDRAVTLAGMLGMSLEEFAQAWGVLS